MTDPRDALIARLAAIVEAFASPNGEHLALRSIYSHRGVCEVYHGRHAPQCQEWQAALIEAAEHLDAVMEPPPMQPGLFSEVTG